MSITTNTKVFIPVSAGLLFQSITGVAQQHAQRPNIVFIMSDDHASKAISCYDGSINKTPQIDRIANNGVRFTNCFCTNAVSGPSRAVILTGQLSHINGMINNEVVFDSASLTLPKVLRANGYQTAIIGKWHLKSEPTGFDFWKVLPGQGEYFNPDFIENGKRKREKGYVTDLVTDYALQWMNQRDTTRPFFIMIHNKAPHRPWLPKPENATMYDTVNIPLPENFYDDFKNRSDAAKMQQMSVIKDLDFPVDLKIPDATSEANSLQQNSIRLDAGERKQWDSIYQIRNESFFKTPLKGNALAEWKYRRYINDYLATIKTVDDNVGRVLDYLKENGLAENTIVIYTSDQGFFLGEHGWFDKRFMYDESYRMPLLIQYPAKIKAGLVNNQMLMNLDFAPSMLEWAGIEKPLQMQGLSFASYIDTAKRLREACYYHYFEYPGEHSVKRHYGIRSEKYKLIHFYYDINQWELFDLQKDPHEMINIYNVPAYLAIQNELMAQLKQMQKEYRDTNFLVPLNFKIIANKALNIDYQILNQPSSKYSGNAKNSLTDGKIENSAFMSTKVSPIWNGFEGTNLEMILPCKAITEIKEIEIRFLDLPDSWIFLPVTLSFSCLTKENKWETFDNILITKEKRTTGGMIFHYKVKVNQKNIQQIKIKAMNHGICPPGHPGEGKPAWIFTDEVIVR